MKECETMKNWIIIPALEPGDGLCAYIRELQQRICASVLVVDDGSGDASRHIFGRIEEMKGCTVLRHEKNRGKGRALKTAFAYVEEQTGKRSRIICVDCDGQHSPEDVEHILRTGSSGTGDAYSRGERFFRKRSAVPVSFREPGCLVPFLACVRGVAQGYSDRTPRV